MSLFKGFVRAKIAALRAGLKSNHISLGESLFNQVHQDATLAPLAERLAKLDPTADDFDASVSTIKEDAVTAGATSGFLAWIETFVQSVISNPTQIVAFIKFITTILTLFPAKGDSEKMEPVSSPEDALHAG